MDALRIERVIVMVRGGPLLILCFSLQNRKLKT